MCLSQSVDLDMQLILRPSSMGENLHFTSLRHCKMMEVKNCVWQSSPSDNNGKGHGLGGQVSEYSDPLLST